MSQQINLYSPVFVKQKKVLSSKAIGQALGVLAVGVLCVYGYAVLQSSRVASLARDLERQVEVQRAQLGKLVKDTGAPGSSQLLAEELARTEARLASGRELLATLRTGELGNTGGFARYLTALARRAVPGTWITGLTLGDGENDMVLRGRVLRAELVPTYIRALSNEDVMRGRKVLELRLSAHRAPQPSAAAASEPRPGAVQASTEFLEFSFVAPRTLTERAVPGATQAAAKGSS